MTVFSRKELLKIWVSTQHPEYLEITCGLFMFSMLIAQNLLYEEKFLTCDKKISQNLRPKRLRQFLEDWHTFLAGK